METESTNTLDKAQVIDVPRLVNGRIDEPGNVDLFKIQGKAGERLAAEGPTQTMKRVSIGVLPAIPFEIVAR